MRLADLVGHERPVALLQQSLLGERISNAYLFVGEEGIGKGEAALAFARALVCESPEVSPERGVYEACGRCAICHLSGQGSYPHLRVIAPDGERIKIDQMRELRHDVSLTSFGGTRRVYIILDAEAMTEESANCILKTLEEPPPGVTLILVTQSTAALLPTILSRCQVVRFRPAPTLDVDGMLVERYDVPPHHARVIAAFSGGRAGWAVRAARRPAVLEVRDRLLHLLARIPEVGPVFVFRGAEEIRLLARELGEALQAGSEEDDAESRPAGASAEDRLVRANADTLLDIARTWFRDLLVLKLAHDLPLTNHDRRAELSAVAEKYAPERLRQSLDAVSRTRHYLARNANVSLALEGMVARLVS